MSVSSSLGRREFLSRIGHGFGSLAFATMLADQGMGSALAGEPTSANPLAPKQPHFPSKAKSVIWLFMNGGQSQVDTWDYKPELAKRDGKSLGGFDNATGFFPEQVGGIMKSPFAFKQYGKSGTWASELFPHLSKQVDDLAFIHSCYTETNNHAPALFQMGTGMSRMGFPCLGSWAIYGLGTMNQNLPAYVVMTDPLKRGLPKGNAVNWSAGFLPGVYQGTPLANSGDPISNLSRDGRVDATTQRRQLDLLHKFNERHLAAHPGEAEIAARMESFELAFRMQTAAPEAFDVTKEPESVRKQYGLEEKRCSHFAKQCLIARRMVERGVRFVQIFSGGMDNERSWDGHIDIVGNHRQFAGETDQPIAALLADLKSRGLLESTLVICCGEFGRLPIAQKGAKPGRDHNPHAFTTWLAGAGVKAGFHYGQTDEIGFKAAVDRVGVHDLHATLLHLLGFDHTKLTYRFNGRDYRLTDVSGTVIRNIIA